MKTQRIAAMADAIAHFASAHSLDDLSREIVFHTRHTLGFDRCGFFFYDAEHHQKRGTWGTDPTGQLTDERGTKAPVYPHEITELSTGQRPITLHENQKLYHLDQYIGDGALVQCAVFDGAELLGWLFLDNFLSQAPFLPEDIDFIVMYGAVVAQLIVRQRQQDQLSQQNASLQSALLQLEQSQREITDSKKMAALGHLVAGVAHQLNTPLGIVVTALSENRHLLTDLQTQFTSGKLTRSLFDDFINSSIDANQLADKSVHRASQLIAQFRQLAAQQELEPAADADIQLLLEDRIRYLNMMAIGSPPQVRVDLCSETRRWPTYAGALGKVLDELLSNAIKHGSFEQKRAEIEIRAEVLSISGVSTLQLSVRDYGPGLDAEQLTHLFEPFYTRNHQKGQGLGASIAYNITTVNLKGRLSAENCAGGGLRYILRLPSAQ